MAILWIGDFRLKQLQQYQTKTKHAGSDSVFLVDDNADVTWLDSVITNQLPLMSLENANVVIMAGFNDCVYSCAWNTFNIDTIADKYAKLLKSLIDQYSNLNFYFCSVAPIDAAYPFAEYKETGLIPKKDLSEKIKQFNKSLKNKCADAFIDSYSYLADTGFCTRDGIRFTLDTCGALQNFIMHHLSYAVTGTFMSSVRVSQDDAPSPTSSDGENSDSNYLYWTSSSADGGLNLCAAHKKASDGAVLPNNIGYVHGRFTEILGETVELPTNTKVADWWTSPTHPYSKGTEPRLGSIICWKKTADASKVQVAVVEYIDKKTDSIIVSTSYDIDAVYDPTNKNHFNVLTFTRSSDDKWGESSDLSFLGFIYCSLSVSMAINKENLCTRNSYGITLDEMKPNAQYIWQYFGSRGWTMNAVAGLLGNMQQESKMSPGVWEGTVTDCETIDNTTGAHTLTNKGKTFSDGYGLTQWTPATKYFTWCNEGGTTGNANGTGKVLPYWEIDSQLQRIEAEVEASKGSWIEDLSQWIKKPSKGYDLTFSEFITSTEDAYWLAGAFAFCYERPGRSTGTAAEQDALKKERGEYGEYWYNFLKSLAPLNTDAPVSDKSFRVDLFRVDEPATESVSASFVVRNGKSWSCKLINTTKQNSGTIDDELQYVTIHIEDLVPNKKYDLQLTVTGTEGNTITKQLSFITKQSYPEAVQFVNLSCNDDIATPNSKFKLNITKPENLGYWKKEDSGYDIQLVVNNKVVNTRTTSVENISNDVFSIWDRFGYSCKFGDTVQIGVRVWVEAGAEKVYDSSVVKTSEPICFISKPVTAYLTDV